MSVPAAPLDIVVLGLGYVGSVTAGCLAAAGHRVVGVDVDEGKVAEIEGGRPPVMEPGLADIVAEAVASGRLRAVTEAGDAVASSDLVMVCVGTPSLANGGLDLTHIEAAAANIGDAIAGSSRRHVVAIRSTVLPGTTRDHVIPILEERSGRSMGDDFDVVVNPEFTREGSAVADFQAPPMTLIGSVDGAGSAVVKAAYAAVDGPVVKTDLGTAELVKFAGNAFHALKVSFANEIGRVAKALDVDGREVMDVFAMDTRLNASAAYLKPGFAFGGSCLPKDVRALTQRARSLDVSIPVLDAVMPSNDTHIDEAAAMVMRTGSRKVTLLGLSFKPATDDLRESPLVRLAEALLGKGFELTIWDPSISPGRLSGANRRYIEQAVPHLGALLSESLDEAVAAAEVIVVGHDRPEIQEALGAVGPEQHVIDLGSGGVEAGRYDGICW